MLPQLQDSSISSREIINQSFSQDEIISRREVVPVRTGSKYVKMTSIMALWNGRQDLLLKMYQISRDNYELKKNIAYLDSRISCLAQLITPKDSNNISDHKKQLYGSMISVLQSEPVHYARLLMHSQLSDTDRLIKIAVESLFQRTDRDEYLLLILIQILLTVDIDGKHWISGREFETLLMTKLFDAYWKRSGCSELFKHLLDSDNPKNNFEEYDHQISFSNAMDAANIILEKAFAALERIPYGVRWIFKQLRSLLRRRKRGIDLGLSVYNLLYLFFVRKIIQLFNENQNDLKGIFLKLGQQFESGNAFNDGSWFLFYSLMTVKIEIFFDSLCKVSDFYRELQIQQYLFLAGEQTIQMDCNDVIFLHQLIAKDHRVVVDDFEDGTLLQSFLEEIELPKVPRSDNASITWPLFNRWTFKTFTHTPSCLLIDYISTLDTVYLDAKYSMIDLLLVLNVTDISPETISSALKSSSGYKILSRRASCLEQQLEDLERLDPGIVYGNSSIFFQEILEEIPTIDLYSVELEADIRRLFLDLNHVKTYHDYLVTQKEAYRVFHTSCRSQTLSRKGPVTFEYKRGIKKGLILNDCIPNSRSLSISISIDQPGIISIVIKDKKKPKLDFQFWVDDILEKKLYDITILKIDALDLSIDAILDCIF